MNPFTVLLLRPDYVADQFGQDTYLAHVWARNPAAAIVSAQAEAMAVDEVDGDFEDYHVLFLCHGHQDDIKERA